jgi:hypothetical protein
MRVPGRSCRTEIGLEQILIHEPHAIGDAGLRGVLDRFPDEPWLDLDADAARAVFLCGGDRDAAVARPEVVDDIGGGHVRHLEHHLDDILRRRDVSDVRRLEPLRRREQEGQEQREHHISGAHEAAFYTSGGFKQFCYAAGWKKFEPLWDAVIRARQLRCMTPLLEGVLSKGDWLYNRQTQQPRGGAMVM